MSYAIETGAISDALVVDQQIPEFDKKKTGGDFESRLTGRRHQILIARYHNEPVGYYVGYEVSPQTFYCWLAGVVPQHRGTGLATQLRELQEKWATEQGYRFVSVKSKNRFPGMLRLLISNGCQISGYEGLDGLLENKIHFIKALPTLRL